jgi:cell division protein FtsB
VDRWASAFPAKEFFNSTFVGYSWKNMSRKSRFRPVWSRRWPRYLLLLLGALVLFKFSGYEVVGGLRDVWKQEAEMRQKIEELRQENARIEGEIKELSPGGDEVERIARQELGWAEPGEIVIKVPEKK